MNTQSWLVQEISLLQLAGIIIIILAKLTKLYIYVVRTFFFFLLVCCRLDRPTSGLLLLTRNQSAAARYSGSFVKRSVKKEYLARVKVKCCNTIGHCVYRCFFPPLRST